MPTGRAPTNLPWRSRHRRRDRGDRFHPIGKHQAPFDDLHATHRSANHRMPGIDAETRRQPCLGANHVSNRDGRKPHAVGLPGLWVRRRWACRPLAATEHIGTDHEPPIGVDRSTRPDNAIPPAAVGMHSRDPARSMRITGERMAHQHCIVGCLVQLAPCLIGDRGFMQHAPRLRAQMDVQQ